MQKEPKEKRNRSLHETARKDLIIGGNNTYTFVYEENMFFTQKKASSSFLYFPLLHIYTSYTLNHKIP